MAKILLVDNEASILSVLSALLKAEGFDVLTARDGIKAKELLQAGPVDLMVSDIRMTPVNGMELLKWTRAECPDVSVVMLTAYGSVETAIEAMKVGAFDYVTKPFKVAELLLTIQRALAYRKAMSENMDLKAQFRTRYRFENIVAESPQMKSVCEMIERVAPTDTTVLIFGESGTGKELVAKAIHAYSKRKNGNFLAINCAAIPEALLESEMFGHVKGSFTGASQNKKGLFEAAEDGTLFLDEIGSMPLNIQGKLLRALQEKEVRKVGGNETIKVNCRVLAATNIKLEQLVESGSFRQDLYYRLSVIPLTIEPLRSRKEDIMPLVYNMMREELGPTRELPEVQPIVRAILEAYPWPGNVRELENAVKHAMTFAVNNTITRDVLPAKILNAVGDIQEAQPESDKSQDHQFSSLRGFLRNQEERYLSQILTNTGGDKEKAAATLKISLATLYRKLPKHLRGDEPAPGHESQQKKPD